MNRKTLWFISSAAAIILVIAIIHFLGTKKEQKGLPLVPGQNTEQAPLSTTLKVKIIYFGDDDNRVTSLESELEVPIIREEIYTKFVNLLLERREGRLVPVPNDTTLLAAYFLKDAGALVLDFSDNTRNLFPGGSAAEQEFIYYIVNNICANFREVQKVMFLFGGAEQRELSGHLDMERAYYPDYSKFENDR